MKTLPTLYFANPEQVNELVIELYNKEQYAQRTDDWYKARDTCISASDVASALMQTPEATNYYIESFNHLSEFDFTPNEKKNCSVYSNIAELILKKCGLGPKFVGNKYTEHGIKFEPIVNTIYSQLNQVDVLEFGLLIHPIHSFLGASPDGITINGKMLEIKCPSTRQVKNHPPINYFIQMQLQLECTGLDECDYFDANFIEYTNESSWEKDGLEWEQENPNSNHHIFGIMFTKSASNIDDINEYIYAPPTIKTILEFKEWKNTVFGTTLPTRTTITYYKLQEYFISTVKYSKKWFDLNFPTMLNIWKKILDSRTISGKQQLEKDLLEKANKKTTKKKPVIDLTSLFP
jgi:putative phage-type endonuclease